MTLILLVIAAAELVAVFALAVALVRSRHEVAGLRARSAPARTGARYAAERAVKAVVETATKVRDHGVGGLLASSLEDLSRWAGEDRAEIVRVAAPNGTVTIVFSDIENSTSLNEHLGDSRWMRVLEAHNAVVRRAVERSGGHVVKSQGDGFMIVFGAPADAVRAALEIQDALHSGGGRLRRAEIEVRIGIHVGKTVARDGDYFGRNVAMAARVAGRAGGGEILASDAVHAALEENSGDFWMDPAGEVPLKGLAGVHTLWAVRRVE